MGDIVGGNAALDLRSDCGVKKIVLLSTIVFAIVGGIADLTGEEVEEVVGARCCCDGDGDCNALIFPCIFGERSTSFAVNKSWSISRNPE